MDWASGFRVGQLITQQTTIRCRVIGIRVEGALGGGSFVGCLLSASSSADVTNKLFSRATCPSCHDQFNRGHIVRCNLLSSLPSPIQEILSCPKFCRDIDMITNQISRKKASRDADISYTPLDFLLNESRYDECMDVIDTLKKLLYDSVGWINWCEHDQ